MRVREIEKLGFTGGRDQIALPQYKNGWECAKAIFRTQVLLLPLLLEKCVCKMWDGLIGTSHEVRLVTRPRISVSARPNA